MSSRPALAVHCVWNCLTIQQGSTSEKKEWRKGGREGKPTNTTKKNFNTVGHQFKTNPWSHQNMSSFPFCIPKGYPSTTSSHSCLGLTSCRGNFCSKTCFSVVPDDVHILTISAFCWDPRSGLCYGMSDWQLFLLSLMVFAEKMTF